MNLALPVCLALVLCAAARAADPPAPATTPPVPKVAVVKSPPPAQALDLRVGDVRKYMMPRDFVAAMAAPDLDSSTVVVEGQRELIPMQGIERVPGGLAGLWHIVKHPSQSWRLLLPDAFAEEAPPTWDKVPPPIFRRGP